MLIRYAEQAAVHRAVMHEAHVPGGPPAALCRSMDGGIWLSHGQPAL